MQRGKNDEGESQAILLLYNHLTDPFSWDTDTLYKHNPFDQLSLSAFLLTSAKCGSLSLSTSLTKSHHFFPKLPSYLFPSPCFTLLSFNYLIFHVSACFLPLNKRQDYSFTIVPLNSIPTTVM